MKEFGWRLLMIECVIVIRIINKKQYFMELVSCANLREVRKTLLTKIGTLTKMNSYQKESKMGKYIDSSNWPSLASNIISKQRLVIKLAFPLGI